MGLPTLLVWAVGSGRRAGAASFLSPGGRPWWAVVGGERQPAQCHRLQVTSTKQGQPQPLPHLLTTRGTVTLPSPSMHQTDTSTSAQAGEARANKGVFYRLLGGAACGKT